MYSFKKLSDFSSARIFLSNALLNVIPPITRFIWKVSGGSNRYDYVESSVYKLLIHIHSRLLLLPNDSDRNVVTRFGKKATFNFSLSRLTDTLALIYGIGEFDVLEIYRLLKRDNDVILDIGANIGTTSIAFASENTSARVISFEPNDTIFEILQSNIKTSGLQDRITAFPFGLGSQNEELYLDVKYEGNPGSAYISTDRGTKRIQIRRLDDLDNVSKISFVKMDVEGHEHFVLQGGEQALLENRPRVILEYFNGFNLENVSKNEDLINLLEKWGYDFYVLKGVLVKINRDFIFESRRVLNIVALPR